MLCWAGRGEKMEGGDDPMTGVEGGGDCLDIAEVDVVAVAFAGEVELVAAMEENDH